MDTDVRRSKGMRQKRAKRFQRMGHRKQPVMTIASSNGERIKMNRVEGMFLTDL